MTSEHLCITICVLAFCLLAGIGIYVIGREAPVDDLRTSAKRLEEAAARVEKQQIAHNQQSLWTFTEKTVTTSRHWVVTCGKCRQKNRVESKDLTGRRCGGCGLPFSKPSTTN